MCEKNKKIWHEWKYLPNNRFSFVAPSRVIDHVISGSSGCCRNADLQLSSRKIHWRRRNLFFSTTWRKLGGGREGWSKIELKFRRAGENDWNRVEKVTRNIRMLWKRKRCRRVVWRFRYTSFGDLRECLFLRLCDIAPKNIDYLFRYLK
jgi:hypothetical protein